MSTQAGEFSLEAKYTLERGRIYLSGIQALVRLPLDQHRADRRRGLNTATFISGYRGSPLGGLDQTLERMTAMLRANEVVFSSGLNEDLGATAVFGSQMAGLFPRPKYDGVLGMWYGKAPGVDRTGDLFKHANYAGVGKNGGVLALAGDDPVSKSSTLPSHSEIALYDAFMPTIFPGNVQEILDLGLHGFMLSRTSGLWVGVKIVTNVADEAATAEVDPERVSPIIPVVELDGKPFQHQINVNLIPPYGLDMERTIHGARLELARRYAYENKLNRIMVPTPNAWLGILTSGKTYYDVRQALAELGLDDGALRRYGVRILKIGMLSPMEPRIVREFARGLQEILVVEEKRPFLEMFCKDVLYGLTDRPQVVGKVDEEERPLLPPVGEFDSDVIARAIARRLARRIKIDSVEARIQHLDELKRRPKPLTLARTAFFCSGCPHNRSTVVPQGSVAAAGIGCHGMAMGMDRGIIGVTHMGAEGAQWIGIAPFTETPHMFQNIGDGTFFHSGGLALNYAVAAGVNITYKILYNGAVAMTGGQNAAGALSIPALSRRLEAEGVKKIVITSDDVTKYSGTSIATNAEVWHRDRLLEAQALLAATPGVTVLIHDQHCAAEKRRLRKRGKMVDPQTRVFINERVCEGCGDCGKKSNCLSVQPIDTEFGRKTAIHQSSCNKDYSCLLGDCPSFLTVVGAGTAPKRERRLTPLDIELPEPALKVPTEGFALHMMGIGGTGVVTINQILGTAALLDGKQVRGLDQTGLSQKGGPVVSDLKISSEPLERANKVSAGSADLYLGFDLLVATDPGNLDKAESSRTVAVVSTSQIPTGQMVVDTGVHFPELASMLMSIDRVTRKDPNVYLDAQAIAEALFGDHMAVNPIMLGAAYQAGALPISAASIERAIRINGVSVEMNVLAFRWGRMAVVDRAHVEAAVTQATTARSTAEVRVLSAEARALVDSVGATGELLRLLEIRVPELIAYQDAAYAREYVDFVRRVAQVEAERAPGRSGLAEAVARHLYKVMAYKDEYEVARLHLDAALQAQLQSKFGPKIHAYWHLHPPLFRALGLKKKLRLGAWFAPAFRLLRAMRRLRSTAFDVFGYAEVRRVERALIGEYRQLIETALVRLTPITHDAVVVLAELPDEIRGYEQIKLDNVARFRDKAQQLISQLN